MVVFFGVMQPHHVPGLHTGVALPCKLAGDVRYFEPPAVPRIDNSSARLDIAFNFKRLQFQCVARAACWRRDGRGTARHAQLFSLSYARIDVYCFFLPHVRFFLFVCSIAALVQLSLFLLPVVIGVFFSGFFLCLIA